jgi:MFS transporter, ACS family, hexuronate transporter
VSAQSPDQAASPAAPAADVPLDRAAGRTVPLARLRWWILGLLFASTAINYLDRQALSVLLPVLRGELQLTSEHYGNIVTAFMLAYMVSQFVSGVLLDRFGTKRGLSAAVLLWSLIGIAHAFARGAVSLGGLRFALGLGEGANWPGGGKAIAEWFPHHRRAFAMGLFDGGSAIGAVLAPPVVSLLALHYGWRSAFVVTGVLGLLWWAAWRWIYDRPERHRWLSPADRATARKELGLGPPTDADRPHTPHPAAARPAAANAAPPIWTTSQFWGLLGTRVLSSPVWWFYVFWLPDFLSKARGLSIGEIGLFGWMPYLTVDLGKIIGGAFSDRLIARGRPALRARQAVMVAGAIGMAAGMCVSGAGSLFAALSWVCLATFGFGLWSANMLALHADVFPAARMGAALGFTGTASSLAGAAASYAIGRLLDTTGYGPVFAAAGALPLVAAALVVFAVRPLRT